MMLKPFLALSAELCGFSEFTLRGTGYAEGYYDTIVRMTGTAVVADLLARYGELPAGDREARDRALRAQILSDERLGPIARNI